MHDTDLRLLRAVQERDMERQRRIQAERAVQALKLLNERLRRRVAILTADKSVIPKPGEPAAADPS
jgi:hypothetical protein